MVTRKLVTPLCLAAMAVGLLVGCEAGSGDITLAKVPPPPEGFGKPGKEGKLPKGTSPSDPSQFKHP